MSSSDSEEQDPVQVARGLLRSYVEGRGAQMALVIDTAGRVITAAGNPGALDPTSFASVCAAHFEANVQLATLVGEPEFRTLLHQGQEASIYLAGVGPSAVLATVFEGTRLFEEVGPQGLELANRLTAPIAEFLGKSVSAGAAGVGSEWVQAVEDEIERVFKEGI